MNDPTVMRSQTLARREIGNVSRCPGGCVHVSLQNFSFRISERQYWELVELLSDASTELARSRRTAAH